MRKIKMTGPPLIAMAAIVAVSLGLAGCYPGGPENIEDVSAVLTVKIAEANYANLMTYAMEDTVYMLDSSSSSAEPLSENMINAIVAQLQASMAAAGFTRIPVDSVEVNKPDIWIDAGAVQSDVWIYYSWGYWGGYYPPGYYPPYTSAVSFKQGSVIWQMVDLRNVTDPGDPDQDELSELWLAGLNGALKESDSADIPRVESGIVQAFAQSPYIKATQPTP